MFATLAKLALAATVLVLFAPSADAQRVHPRCVNSKDKVRCSCWLSNGASRVIRPDGKAADSDQFPMGHGQNYRLHATSRASERLTYSFSIP